MTSQTETVLDVIVVGDGPGGLSAALFLARGGLKVTVYGQDKTAMHWALIKNYLGIEEIPGGDFQRIAKGQVQRAGGQVVDGRVESLQKTNEGFAVTLEGGGRAQARFLILSEGKSPRLALELGLARNDNGGVRVDDSSRTSMSRVYAIGRLARPTQSQAIISAGNGAAAALDILSTLKGEPVQDWDELPESK